MANVGELVARLTMDTADFEQGAKRAGTEAKGAGRRTRRRVWLSG